MKELLLTLLLATTAAAQAAPRCSTDADCQAGETCVTQKVACAVHPESSTCATRLCRRKPVEEADRACKKDSDCAIAVREFRCMYCAQPADAVVGVVGAVNKKRAKKYEAAATPDQQRRCAMAGPCAQTGEMKARCREKLCVADYAPRR